MKIYVYVAGPISVGPYHRNLASAIAAGERLRKAGLIPFVPHAMSDSWATVYAVTYEEWMDYDFAWVERCDALLRIPGESKGADREVAYANKLNIPVFYEEEKLIAWTARRTKTVNPV